MNKSSDKPNEEVINYKRLIFNIIEIIYGK